MNCDVCGITLSLTEEIEDKRCLQCCEALDEKLSRFSDRQIVVEVLELLDKEQTQTLVNTLERNY